MGSKPSRSRSETETVPCPPQIPCNAPVSELQDLEICLRHVTVLYFASKLDGTEEDAEELDDLYHRQSNKFHLITFSATNKQDQKIMQTLEVTTYPSVFIIDPRDRKDGSPGKNLLLRIFRYGGHMTADDIFQCAKDVLDCRSVSVTQERIQELFPNMARLVKQQEAGMPQKTRSMEGRTHTMKANKKRSTSVRRGRKPASLKKSTRKRSVSRKSREM
jgi:hypothetical protein